MAKINFYLLFNGNCEEAFNFYKSAFGIDFTFIGRYGDIPPQNGMPPISEDEKNKIENSNQSIIDTENLIIGSTFSGKMPMIINGLDLYYLILLLQGKQITIIELGNKTLYEGNASDCNYERVEYEVIKFEKIHYDNSYTITVRKV